MTVKKGWYGAYGPYAYDDTSQYDDGVFREGARIEGQVLIEEAPTQDHHVIRLEDAPDLNIGFKKMFMIGE